MRRLMGGLVCVLLLVGATVSGAQEPASCRWAPDSATVDDAYLQGVAAVDSTNVFAVGAVVNSQGRPRTLVRHWDGSSWETQTSPNVNTQAHELTDVAAAPDGTMWAVGVRGGKRLKTVVQRYDGSSWQMLSSLNPSEDKNLLGAVDVAPSGDVYVAGDRLNEKGQFRTMIQRYNGKGWVLFASRYPGVLWDLDVIADDDVWAVGEKGLGVRARTLVLHFDGTKWTEVATPSPGPGFSALYSVSAAAPDDVWAAGEWWGGDAGEAVPWMVHFDGTSWSAAELPDLTTNGGFSGVSALDTDTAVAVGVDYSYPVEESRIVIEWNGTSWTRAEQDGGTPTAWLAAVDLAPDGGGWTVGSNQSGSPFEGNYVSTDYIERRTCG